MELQNDFEEPAGACRTHDDNSNGGLLMPQPDRPAMRQCFLYFVPRDSMFFPYFLFNEGFNDEFAEPQSYSYTKRNAPRKQSAAIGHSG